MSIVDRPNTPVWLLLLAVGVGIALWLLCGFGVAELLTEWSDLWAANP